MLTATDIANILATTQLAAADGNMELVQRIAIWAAAPDMDTFYCDLCGNTYSQEIIEIAEDHDLPTTVAATDESGIQGCGWCILEDRDAEPPDYDCGYIHDTPDNVGDYKDLA